MMVFKNYLPTAVLIGVIATVGVANALPRMSTVQIHSKQHSAIHPASSHIPGLYRGFHHKEREAAKRRYRDLPPKHVEYCNRLISAYRQSDNTIAYDRYTRVQCFSPYFRPY